jgi:hypothetical protein
MRYFDWKLQISELPRKVWLYDLSEDNSERLNIAEGISVDVLRMWTANNCFEDRSSVDAQEFAILNSRFEDADDERDDENRSLVSRPLAWDQSQHAYSRTETVEKALDRWLVSTKSKIDAFGHVDAESTTLSKLQLTCNMLRILDRIDGEQSMPLWPSVSETVVRVDEPSYLEGTSDGWNARTGEEYIYWPN